MNGRVTRLLATAGVLAALAGSALAAGGLLGRASTPAQATVTIASTAPLFQESGLVPGQSFERCTVLTNEGPQPADVTLFGSAAQSGLSPWLELELVRGSLPAGTPAGDCTGFAPDPVDYGAGSNGVVFQGTLDELPDAAAGIADPTRWAVGERHAYLLRVDYSGDNAAQGRTTVQSFAWGVTPFDDRPAEPGDPGDPATPGEPGQPPAPGAPAEPPSTPQQGGLLPGACTVVSFPNRAYIGARAITKPRVLSRKSKKRKARRAAHRTTVLAATAGAAARRTPTLVVRLAPDGKRKLTARIGLRNGTRLSSPRRWKWVRVRINGSPARTTVRWPFRSTMNMTQLRQGYNQIDITLHRGAKHRRVKGLPALMRRSFGFVVKSGGGATTTSACTLG